MERNGRSTSVVTRLHEADVERAKGNLESALELYQTILEDFPSLSSQMVASVRRKMEEVTQEMAEQGGGTAVRVEETVVEESVSSEDERSALSQFTERADALCDLGMFEQAAAEYEEVFSAVQPDEVALVNYTRCLLNVETPDKALTRLGAIFTGSRIPSRRKVDLLLAVAGQFDAQGLEEEAASLRDQANALRARSAASADTGGASARRRSGKFDPSRYESLIRTGVVTRRQLREAADLAAAQGSSVEFALMEHFGIDKKVIGKALSEHFGCPFRAFDSDTPVPYELLQDLRKQFLLNDHWVPIKWSKLGIEVLVDDPGDIGKTDHIRALIKSGNIVLSVGIQEDIRQYIELFFGEQQLEEAVDEGPSIDDLIPDIEFQEVHDQEEEELDAIDESANQIVRLVDQLLVTAFREGVSDIHIEPSVVTRRTHIRFRRDGVCQEYLQIPNNMVRAVVSRLKIMAGLDIAERRLPQDGKIRFRRKGIPTFELRMATIPTAGGFEDVVLRILATAGAMKLEDMGLNERNLSLLKRVLVQPYGLVLVVGPTGSGKTTTLHAALGHINNPGIKIWTAEDPIEITQAGLRQVEVQPKIGLDFARVMRAFLRADPDVIMIGEMRDLETASIAIEASLTGHLVFSTLHTNSAPETVTRLLDMGLNPLNFSDALLGVLAQRLVRRLCTGCRRAYHPSTEEWDDLVMSYGEEAFPSLGVSLDSGVQLYQKVGCDACAGSGYRGRMGIHEFLLGTPAVKRLIKKAAPTEEIFAQAAEEGMTTLRQDGVTKVLQGLTDMDEIRRVCIG